MARHMRIRPRHIKTTHTTTPIEYNDFATFLCHYRNDGGVYHVSTDENLH